MAFCTNCGNELKEDAAFCSVCGEKVKAEATTSQQTEESFVDKVVSLNDTADNTAEYDVADINNRKIISLFSYIYFLVFIPFFAASESKFARFHVNQGLVLFIANIAFAVTAALVDFVLGYLPGPLAFIIALPFVVVQAALITLAVVGIINAVKGKAKELPIIGKFKILK